MNTLMSRRQVLGAAVAAAGGTLLPHLAQAASNTTQLARNEPGAQRLSLDQLRAWQSLGYGMFIHFGMSTFDGEELSLGDKPSSFYAPDRLDVDQWVSVARDAGMKYAILTTKHVSGHCLWPSKYTDYHVGTSGNRTDVVGAFVEACKRRGVIPGFYYCSWDNHHRFGSVTPSDVPKVGNSVAYTSAAYQEFQWQQIDELLTQYAPVGEWWIDIPFVLPRDYRNRLYARIAEVQPASLIMMNTGIGDGTKLDVGRAWPSDLVALERFLPNSQTKFQAWREVEGKRYFVPGEVCDPIGGEWFHVDGDPLRSDAELLGMYLVTRARRQLVIGRTTGQARRYPHADGAGSEAAARKHRPNIGAPSAAMNADSHPAPPCAPCVLWLEDSRPLGSRRLRSL